MADFLQGHLYDYQMDAFNACLNHSIGTVVLPTGTGKTRIQAAIIANSIKDNPESGIYVINCPRIILSFQLLKEVYRFITNLGIDARYMFVHSGGEDDIKEYEEIRLAAKDVNGEFNIKFAQIRSTTSPVEIQDMIETCQRTKLPLVILSTYNSYPRIDTAIQKTESEIDIVFNDEAHYLVREDFHKIIYLINGIARKRYNFTATARVSVSACGRGMNNAEKYGDIIYEMKPREAIERGRMVRPRLHTFTSDDIQKYSFEDYEQSMSKIVYECFKSHQEQLNKSKQSAKILVSSKGVGDIERFLNSDYNKKLRELGVDVFAVASSEKIGNRINESSVSRKDFLKILKEYGEDESKKIIVIHYDILSEGIDVSGFTGILPLRTLEKSKFLQTFGRCARLHPSDREAFSAGLYGPNDLGKLRKPYAWVMLPKMSKDNQDDFTHLEQLVLGMREFGFDVFESVLLTDRQNGLVEEEEIDTMNDPEKKLGDIGSVIEKILSEIEREETASLQPMAFIYYQDLKSEKLICEYKIFDTRKDAMAYLGRESAYVLSVSKNAGQNIATALLNRARTTNKVAVYYCDGPNEWHLEPWNKLMEKHPEYEGKFLLPVFS